MLESLITSKTRLKLLVRFFVSSANKGHLRGLAEEFDESTNAIRKELNQLADAGYLLKEPNQNRILYSANIRHPLFTSLQKLIHSYLGIDDIIDHVLRETGDLSSVLLVGDYAKGLDTGTIELIINGSVNTEYLAVVVEKVEKLLKKKIILHINKEGCTQEGIFLFQE